MKKAVLALALIWGSAGGARALDCDQYSIKSLDQLNQCEQQQNESKAYMDRQVKEADPAALDEASGVCQHFITEGHDDQFMACMKRVMGN